MILAATSPPVQDSAVLSRHFFLRKTGSFQFHITLKCLIEYDGQQHYREVSLYSFENVLEYTKANDEIKNKYCKDNKVFIGESVIPIDTTSLCFSSSTLEEFMKCFIVLGYDMNGNPINLVHANNQQDADSLSTAVNRFFMQNNNPDNI